MQRLVISTVITIIALLGAGCSQESSAKNDTPAATKDVVGEVVVAEVAKRTLTDTLTVPADLEGDEQAQLMAKINAYVKEVFVDIGDEVEAGQALVSLDAPEMNFEVESKKRILEQAVASRDVAEAELKAAHARLDEQSKAVKLRRSEHDRTKGLVTDRALGDALLEEAIYKLEAAESALASRRSDVSVAQAKLASAASDIEAAKADVRKAEAMASYQTITAPFAGVVTERNIDPGEFVRPADGGPDARPLVKVAHVDKVRAIAHLSMDQAADVSNGAPAIFRAEDVANKEFVGEVKRNSMAYHRETRMLRIEVDLPNAVDPETSRRPLRANGYGTLTVELSDSTQPAVPIDAIQKRGNAVSVITVDEKGVCHEKPVKIGVATSVYAGIASGLDEGEQVIAADVDRYKDEQQLPADSLKTWQSREDPFSDLVR